MKRRSAQRGVALIAMLAAFALGASYFLVSKLHAESGVIDALRKERNAQVLNRAKQALIGYVAAQAAKAGENNPGAMPCPENPADFDDTTGRQGLVGTSCTTTTIGRFPWRTLGLDKLVDASGEPLWYVVGPGWGASPTTNTVINSDSIGQLTVDGAANDAIALIIAPGPAFTVAAAAGCNAFSQVRPTTGTPDWRNYLECDNATSPADASFVTTGPSGSFNDQVVKVTVADVLPALEAAIAARIGREIAPVLPTVYAAPGWGLGGSSRKYPFAAPFASPATSAMQGAAGTLQGLMPLAYAETSPGSGVLCTPGVSVPRCAPAFVAWSSANMGSSPSTYGEICNVTATQITCTFYYRCLLLGCGAGTTPFILNATAANVGMALRQLNPGASMTNVTSVNSLTGTLTAAGAADIVLDGNAAQSAGAGWLPNALCGIGWPLSILLGCKQSTITVPIALFADHPLLDPGTGSATGWFLRNRWHEVTYYALAAGYAPSGAAACTTGGTCLSVANVTPPGAQRSILILAGRSINGSTRPSGALANYLEFGNATSAFERQPESTVVAAAQRKPFNDRIVVVDSN